MKEWYDGYRFGNVDVDCPWDVINFCSDHLADPGLEPKNYWANTSGNSVISHFIDSVGKPQKLTRMVLEQEGIHTIIKYGIACYRKKLILSLPIRNYILP